MFKFKGISSNDMQVVVEEEEHFIARAPKRYNMTEIDGKDGAIFEELGYSYIERPIRLQCLNINKIDDILAWLNGEGEFEYKNRKTIARFYAELSPQRNACIRIIDTNFIRDPFWNSVVDEYVEVTDTIENIGNIESRPIIKLMKTNSDNVELTIGGVRFKYNFENDTEVIIDCEEKTVKYDNLIRNRQIEIDYDFPKLKVGISNITNHSGDCKIEIMKKDRWL